MDPEQALLTVLKKCPTGFASGSACALSHLRGVPHDELEKKLHELPPEELDKNLRTHLFCLCKQQGCEIRDAD